MNQTQLEVTRRLTRRDYYSKLHGMNDHATIWAIKTAAEYLDKFYDEIDPEGPELEDAERFVWERIRLGYIKAMPEGIDVEEVDNYLSCNTPEFVEIVDGYPQPTEQETNYILEQEQTK